MTSLAIFNGEKAAEHVAGFASGLAAALSSAADQADSTLKLLKERSLKPAADKDPGLAQRLASIEENTRANLKEFQSKEKVLQQAIAQMQQDLANFLKSAPPPSPSGPGTPPPAPSSPPTASPAKTPTRQTKK